MGLILTAYCEKCGFKREEIFFGAGKSNHKTVCDVPAIVRNTNQFVVENYFNKENIGDNIQFYTDQELFKGGADKNAGTWRWDNVLLQIAENKCPECNNYVLEFIPTGSFD
jgi:hypothetical protein